MKKIVDLLLLLSLLWLVSTGGGFPVDDQFKTPASRKVYADFTEGVLGYVKRAGFKAELGKLTVASGRLNTQLIINDAPATLKKYIGSPPQHTFVLEGAEAERDFVFSLYFNQLYQWPTKEKIFVPMFLRNFSIPKQETYLIRDYLGRVIEEWFRAMVIFMYEFDCGSRYGYYSGYQGYTGGLGGISAHPLGYEKILLNYPYRYAAGFSRLADEFLRLVSRELKNYDLRFTIVENAPRVEIRIFQFPSVMSRYFPEPPSTLFALVFDSITKKSNGQSIPEEAFSVSVFDRAQKKFELLQAVVALPASQNLAPKAKEVAEKIFFSLYLPKCTASYGF